ncbi:hypothetical protein IQ265_26135 [Nodosilinea sp. LEGE 06152]|uniref:hypothetical protein n=1 Tax=Nodosilinea sp. LEGE 06152 TaxID=2777966 RepID=UPI001880DC10|nr:hypothetical protein [Nodosilinea sp. LEGE 06152]MBE9160272.1 hypothetical protein [Nodosilinea sp. LEGE 06152]
MNRQSLWQRWSGLAAGVSLLVVGVAWMPAVDADTAGSNLAQSEASSALPEIWQPASAEDEALVWQFVLQSPLGVAALNQLAIEGFISPVCEKTLYTHVEYGSFQTLLQVQCPTPGGVSTARAYDEMRVTFNRFEDTINDFSVERIYVD